MPIASLTTFKPQLNLSDKNSFLTRFPWITTNKRNKKKMQTTKCTSFGQEKFRLIMALAQSIKKYWNSILPGRLGLCGQVTPPIILKIWLIVEKMRDQSTYCWGSRRNTDMTSWRLITHMHTTERCNPKRKLTCKIKNKRNKKGFY